MHNEAIVSDMLARYSLISNQVDRPELRIILNALLSQVSTAQERCAVVEFGCYIGTTSLFIRRLLDALSSHADFHVYDSFSGLPEKTVHDQSPVGEQFKAGELTASRKQFEMQFKKAGLKTPVIHKGWFRDLTSDAVSDTICFAYLDGDYYESIRDSLRLIWPKLTSTATVVVDDYANEALPGAARAVDEWLKSHPASVRVQSSLAIIQLG